MATVSPTLSLATASVSSPVAGWKKYSQLVEKSLQSFDNVNEWADFITFLAKLLKCLQGFPQFPLIPHKLTVAKRLSQCLNPALPTGVHQRALDVYTHILTVIGTENLKRDLPAWSSGLFPFFQYAATSVKPIVLGIYERFYLPLQESLRPATKAFILALLPGVEEETGEFFEKVAALLDRVSGTVSPSFFFQNMWLVLVTAPNSRIPALNYLSRRMPKMETEDSLSHIVGQDVGLMVRGFAAALEDSQILVQRGILDLLITTLKLDSAGFKGTRRDDQILLMRAVMGVVLRRDLSLSRRLYAWLLGPSEASETQIVYLKEYGLELLRCALKADMDAQTTDTLDRQRPFKIFISLLDKWEIGGPLTEVLVLDAFASLRVLLRPNDDHDELLMTGNMLFEIIDPFLMWKQIFFSVRDTIKESLGTESIELAKFIVRTFRLHDEEVQKLHAPFVAFGILDLVEASSRSATTFVDTSSLTAAMEFTSELLHEISPRFYETGEASDEVPPEHLGLSLANELYGSVDMKTASLPETEGREFLIAGFVSAMRLAATCSGVVSSNTKSLDGGLVGELLIRTLGIIETLAAATAHSKDNLALDWNPDEWVNGFVKCLATSPSNSKIFPLHSAIINSILTLAGTPTIQPALQKGRRSLVEALTSKLLEYLQPPCAPCFVESVQLMWGVEALSDCRHVESMISERLSSPNPAIRLPAFEAFGNLWRFTEDSQLPGVVLRTPMFMMLDSLKADDLSTRRAGEAWMRCSLKSYLRILDPLLFTLLDPAIKQLPSTVTVAGVQLPILVYHSKFDQARVHHVLDDLLSLARFGGQGLIRIAKGSFLKHSLDPSFRERVRHSELETYTYLDGLVAVLVRFLRAEPAPELAASLGPLNHHIHAVVAELLQVVLSRGESEMAGIKSIEAALTSRLYLCIHRSELDLQNKLLHVLHSVVHAVTSGTKRHKGTPSLEVKAPEPVEAQPVDLSHDEMFVRVVSDAVSIQRNNAVIHHWIDFLLMTIPQYRHALHSVIFPLVDCLVNRLRALVVDFQRTYSTPDSDEPPSEATDAEYTVLMNALERLLLIAVTESLSASADEEPKQMERVVSDHASAGGAGGLLGYMTGVLGNAELEHSEVSDENRVKNAGLARLRDSVNLLLFSWEVTSRLESPVGEEHSTSQGYFLGRAKVRARKALERVYKASPADVLDDIVSFWDKTRSNSSTPESEANVFTMLDILAPSPQTVVTMLCEKLAPKTGGAAGKVFTSTDDMSFAFFEAYLNRVEGPIAVQVWATCLQFIRDFLGNMSTSKPYIFPCLRIFTTLSEKVSQTSALEDRRMRRDLQETFIRLTDTSIVLAGRAVEQSGWLRRAIDTNGDTDSIVSDKGKPESEDVEEEKRPAPAANQAREITEFLAQRILADFRRFLIDPDKTVAVCSNMVYYIVTPAFKTRSKTLEIEPTVFELLTEMAKNPLTLKAWRTQVSDAFGDNRFFNAPPSSHARWKPLIQALMASDKERLVELAAKVSTVSSANIFTNRELESLSRALSLRRLTYTILTGEKDRFLTQLPIIQEKLVDLLRSSVGDMVHAEVYLCLRVLFCRIGNHHLAGLWPVILTELLRLFESLVDQVVPDGSDLLQLILSACKFLDLTLVLQTEEFQIHEWMFVTDTVDAIYPPDAWLPQAIMDRLGEIISRTSRPQANTQDPAKVEWAAGRSRPRQPTLTLKRINSIAELEPFFTTVSLMAYESIYHSAGKVDIAAVEAQLVADLFDGVV
ncbi:cellular morphogenesis-related protein [Pseudohyphozyma bogoriensis]|nr:cellular morphogenesis-related protein [Pseudohyphozyma bogoriensis]